MQDRLDPLRGHQARGDQRRHAHSVPVIAYTQCVDFAGQPLGNSPHRGRICRTRRRHFRQDKRFARFNPPMQFSFLLRHGLQSNLEEKFACPRDGRITKCVLQERRSSHNSLGNRFPGRLQRKCPERILRQCTKAVYRVVDHLFELIELIFGGAVEQLTPFRFEAHFGQ